VNLIKEKVGVECKVVNCRENETVIIIKFENEGIKNGVKKYKLKGNKIFIENDLSWEEKKIQGKINRWTRKQRRRRLDVNVELEE